MNANRGDRPEVRIAAFIKRRWSVAASWPRESIVPWVRWYLQHGNAAIGLMGKRIAAVGLARPLRDSKDWRERYQNDEDGSVVFVDLAIARHKLGLRFLFSALMERFKDKAHVAFSRKPGGIVRIYAIEQMMNHLEL